MMLATVLPSVMKSPARAATCWGRSFACVARTSRQRRRSLARVTPMRAARLQPSSASSCPTRDPRGEPASAARDECHTFGGGATLPAMTQSLSPDVATDTIEIAAEDRELEAALADWFRAHGPVLVGFSGGVDSAYLACVAVDAVGRDNV